VLVNSRGNCQPFGPVPEGAKIKQIVKKLKFKEENKNERKKLFSIKKPKAKC